MKRKPNYRYAVTLLCCAITWLPSGSQAADARDPEIACALMAAHGLPTRGAYRPAGRGIYACRSEEKKLRVGGATRHTIRYRVTGTAEAAERLTLKLGIHSRENVQRGHAALADAAASLMAEALDAEMPEAMRVAILSASNRQGTLDSAEVVVEKAQIRSASYELWVRILLR